MEQIQNIILQGKSEESSTSGQGSGLAGRFKSNQTAYQFEMKNKQSCMLRPALVQGEINREQPKVENELQAKQIGPYTNA